MAIYHLSMKPISRQQGRSAVAAAAYRAGTVLTNERDGLTHDFRARQGVAHTEIVLPEGVEAAWAQDRSQLWNAAELAEKRKDARTAREFEIALPFELNAEQRLQATRMLAQAVADLHGTAVDFAIHAPHDKTDVRNHHAHLLMTTRTIEPDGLGEKSFIELSNRKLQARGLPTADVQLRYIRQMWEEIANAELARAGLDIRIDHRSHEDRGLEIEPTEHMGVHATQMERRGLEVARGRTDEATARRNAELIRRKPEEVLRLLTDEKSVFDRRDIARTLHRYIDDRDAFQAAFAAVMASRSLIELQREGPGGEPARYSTKEMVATEREMADGAEQMAKRVSHAVAERHVQAAISRQDQALRTASGGKLSDEQRQAIEHVTSGQQIAAVIGAAGAGKSTMLAAAREAWQTAGYRVQGAALAGKAAEELEESSGIESRTLASFEMSWQNDRRLLGTKDVLVIDEAGMIGSRQLARFIGEAERRGAKIVLVGDHQQLQAIGAGAPFRAVTERVGFAQLQEVRRQRADWQRAASLAFARHDTARALAAYGEHGSVALAPTQDDAKAALVRDYMADQAMRPEASRIILTHRRVDVAALNEAVRTARQARGELGKAVRVTTNDGEQEFAAGDRIVFLENNRDLAVKNGMLGTVRAAEPGRLTVSLDGSGKDRREIEVSTADYAAIAHGYAITIHKAQGGTVDRAFVLASESMDRHLAYVAMTRHRDAVKLYAGQDRFSDMAALTKRLSRDGSKETTLDYAARRGIEGGLVERVRSDVANALERAREKTAELRALYARRREAERQRPGGLER